MDFSYLESVVGGERSIVFEVLGLFRGQAELWRPRLTGDDPDWRAVAHTIKGAARGIGAAALGDLCHTAEFGQPQDLAAVRAELAAVLAEIAAYEAAKGAP